jgi:perosamine synthetase
MIHWATASLLGNEKKYVLDAISSTWISGGPYVDRLEKDLRAYCGSPNVLVSSNGTTAIHLAYLAANLQPGDEVILPGFGYMAAANVALHMHLRPIFCEVDPKTWCMRAQDVEKVLTPKTKAIVPIHTYGNVCEMKPILKLAQKLKLAVIEDAAEAFGSTYEGKRAGTLSSLGTYSFHATKTISTGEGGAVTTDREDFAQTIRLMRSHGVGATRYLHQVAGHNFRMTNMQAALGCAQLEQVQLIAAKRRELWCWYKDVLSMIPGVTLQHFEENVDAIVWAVAVVLDPKIFSRGRDNVMCKMSEEGIETRPGFYSANSMQHLYGSQQLVTCDYLARNIISLPSSPVFNKSQIESICESLAQCHSSS